MSSSSGSIASSIQRAILSPDWLLSIDMPLHSKARPRMTRSGHTYMDPRYKAAREEMRRHLRRQWHRPPLEGPIALYVKLTGEGRGDADNIVGFLMDAGGPLRDEPAITWVDDRVSIISPVIVEWVRAPKAQSNWLIQIAKIDP